MNASTGFPALLEEPVAGKPLVSFARRAVFIPLGIATALLVAWASMAPVSGAVVAGARIKVELERKTVQHREGGIVREIKVRNGQKVRAGDVLVMIDDVRSDAELSLLEDQLRAERVRHARVSAEAALARQFDDKAFAGDARMGEHLERERAQFAARRRTLEEQLDALQLQMGAARAQSAAIESQIESARESARLAAQELELNEKLVKDGYVSRARVLALQRSRASTFLSRSARRSKTSGLPTVLASPTRGASRKWTAGRTRTSRTHRHVHLPMCCPVPTSSSACQPPGC